MRENKFSRLFKIEEKDSIEKNDLTSALEKVSEGKYEYFFQGMEAEDEERRRNREEEEEEERSQSRNRKRSPEYDENGRRRRKSRSRDRRRRRPGGSGGRRGGDSREGSSRDRRRRRDDSSEEDDRSGSVRSVTCIAWNRDRYRGTPLQLGDGRLRDWKRWLKQNSLTVVKLDSRERVGVEDVYPSMIAISWHGKDYQQPLRKRTQECEDFFEFLCLLREKNWNVPILVGGDFNMDMKSFSLKAYPGFALVPYRPVSGTLAKDLKNTFLYTMDCLQVTETGFKQHHPETFPNPFITVRVRGRFQIRVWAVVRIQRAVRRWLRRIHEREEAREHHRRHKDRWKKKLDYRSEDEDDYYYSDEDDDDPRLRKYTGAKAAQVRRTKKFDKTPKKDRKYALFWDEKDDPRYEDREMSQEEYEHRRRKDFATEGSRSVMDDMSKGQNSFSVDGGGHRRKKFNDLKSIYDKRREDDEIEHYYGGGGGGGGGGRFRNSFD